MEYGKTATAAAPPLPSPTITTKKENKQKTIEFTFNTFSMMQKKKNNFDLSC